MPPYPAPIDPAHTNISLIGTGVIGAAIAARLLAAGYSLTIHSRTPSKASHLLPLGATLSPSPAAAAASSHILLLSLSHPSDVHSVFLSALPSLAPNSVIVDFTSSSPALAATLFSAAKAHHVFSVDAPVSGGDIGAREGTLAILAGGEQPIVSWLTPMFDILGKVTYMGGPGCGQSAKIANQIVVGGCMVGMCEAIMFVKAEGLDEGKWMEAVREGSARTRCLELFGERVIGRDFRPGGFAEYFVKDLGMALEGGEVVLPGTALCKQMFVGMVAQGNGKMGMQGLITVLERLNGREEGEKEA